MAIKKQTPIESMRGPERTETVFRDNASVVAPIRSEMNTKSSNWLWTIVAAIVALIILGVGYYFYHQHTLTPAYQQAQASADAKDIIASVGRLMVLPTGEDPAIFNVADPSSLTAQQAFFAGAIKGDKLLVYQKSQKAIIYSPSRNIIVNVGPITADATNPPAKSSAPVSVTSAASTTQSQVKKEVPSKIVVPVKVHK